MHDFKGTWYDMNEIKLIEHIQAKDQQDAMSKLYIKYGGKNTPGPCLLVEKEP